MLNNSHQTPVEVPSGLSSVANAGYNDSIEAEASSLPPRTKSQKNDGKVLERARTESPLASPVKRRTLSSKQEGS